MFVCFLIFLLEMVLSVYSKLDYRLSFFFWLDLLSLLSMLFDIYFLVELLFGDNSFMNVTGDATNVARAGRASRVGTRAGRLIKMMRLIKLIRVAKVYKQTSSVIKKGEMKKLNKRMDNDPFTRGDKFLKLARDKDRQDSKKRGHIIIEDDERKKSFIDKVVSARSNSSPKNAYSASVTKRQATSST